MGNKLNIGLRSGITNTSMVVLDSTGKLWSTTGTDSFQTYDSSHVANNAISGTEIGSLGIYTFPFPSAAAGQYSAYVVEQAGGSLAESDFPVTGGPGVVEWDGSAFIEQTTVVSNVLNTAMPASPTANSVYDYLEVMDAVLGGVTNTDTANQAAFKDRSGNERRRVTYGTADGSRSASTIS
ncbi:hypothetical protein LCGC14_0325690 [marine sediment metagenome]|uniref:Uncharacterized protein n=1 Tax=marine sediment metagenome TaxID=412755 RepID=A0A0F9WPY4_9ZZZZ